MATRVPQVDAVSELQNAFTVLFRNWVLAVPTALVSLLAAVFAVFMVAGLMASVMGAGMMGGMHPNAAGAILASGGITVLLGVIVLVLLSLVANAVVVASAERVWHGEAADLSAGFSKALSKLGPLIVLFIIAAVIGFICSILALALGLGIILGIVLLFFFMYTIPAVVVGNRGAMEALGESSRLVRANVGPSAIAFLGLIVVNIIGAVITNLFHAIPFLSIVLSFVVGGLIAAYSALVTVRFYDVLSGTPAGRVPVAPTAPSM